jgi:hypothetical protein
MNTKAVGHHEEMEIRKLGAMLANKRTPPSPLK